MQRVLIPNTIDTRQDVKLLVSTGPWIVVVPIPSTYFGNIKPNPEVSLSWPPNEFLDSHPIHAVNAKWVEETYYGLLPDKPQYRVHTIHKSPAQVCHYSRVWCSFCL